MKKILIKKNYCTISVATSLVFTLFNNLNELQIDIEVVVKLIVNNQWVTNLLNIGEQKQKKRKNPKYNIHNDLRFSHFQHE
jgi:hypothetical protein